MLTAVFFWLLIVCVLLQCGYILHFFLRVYRLPPATAHDRTAQQAVSVIICARNEARNLELNLPSILSQRYTNDAGKHMFEVIVVNDASEDDTEQVLYELEQRYTQLWHVTISADTERRFKGKKFPLSQGISYATYPLLLLTDADCKPTSENWISCMTAPLNQGKQIVAGYGGHRYRPGPLNAFIRWETVHTFLQFAGYAMAGKPYMAVGRNLACTKEILLQGQRSEVWNELPSGDDDLLVACSGTADNMAIVMDTGAFTFSEAKKTWKEWIRQKQRHVSTGKYYKKQVKALLTVYAGTHALSWVLFFALLFSVYWKWSLTVMLIRCVIYWPIFQAIALRLRDTRLSIWIPLCDIGWVLYNFILAPYIFWKNKQQWK